MSITLVPGFRQGRRGHLFTMEFRPAQGLPNGVVIHLPAFAEEMNKARRQVALQARALAEQGWLVVIADLYGCGDSQGDFQEADWALWLDDLEDLARELTGRCGPPVLWGLRVGALLARELLERIAVGGLLLWQPVTQGQQFLGQFLRLRLAATMLSGESRETVAGLREILRTEGVLEVAGYGLGQSLASHLDQVRLSPPAQAVNTAWLEVVGSPERGISPANRQVIDAWRDSGCDLHEQTVVGEPFWSAQEIKVAPALLTATREILHGWRLSS